MSVHFSFPVVLAHTVAGPVEVIAHGEADCIPKGPSEVSYVITKLVSADGVCQLDPKVLDLVLTERQLAERVIETLIDIEWDEREGRS